MLRIALNETALSPGAYLEGTCQWLPDRDERNKKARLMVGWRTEGRGDVDKATIYEQEILADSLTAFTCQIPLTGPYSYDGQLLRIIWEVTAEVAGAFNLRKTHQTQVFRVVSSREGGGDRP
ncbi:MAG: hypothetical protein GC158_09200 [Cyanobacteria bacterium RI_101]|nr:hypothetical protein [Cyanobacteria bacterium RI_101]